jgi:hypothetical protein
MPVPLKTLLYLGADFPCIFCLALLLRWARPLNGELSPKLHPSGMESLVIAIAVTFALLGIAFLIGAVVEVFKQ